MSVSLFACAGSSSSREPQGCTDQSGCQSNARCVEGGCVLNAAPVAAIASIGSAKAYALIALDGSGSSDPDAPVDAIASYAWSVTSAGAPCPPPTVAGTSATAKVRFACAGTYEVRLVVKDGMGLESAPAQATVVVGEPDGPSSITVGADLQRDHACSGSPLVCQPTGDPVVLSANVDPSVPAEATLRWSVQAPEGRALDANRRITFSPSAEVAAPTVTLTTDGTAISGDWLFQVELRDSAGVLGRQTMRVSVGNRPPTVFIGSQVNLPHFFDPANSRFVVDDRYGVDVGDPDGDPVTPSLEFRHVGDGAGTFDGSYADGFVRIHITVPYASPADGAYLIGGPGLERTLVLRGTDVNGATSEASAPVGVLNSPPAPTSTQLPRITVAHRFDAVGKRYVASTPLTDWQDPERDPLYLRSATGDGACSTVTFVEWQAHLTCEVPFQGTPDLKALVGTHVVKVRASDPWAEAIATRETAVTVTNGAPRILADPIKVNSTCDPTTCRRRDAETGECLVWNATYPAMTASLTGRVLDDEGDPLTLTVGGTSVCLPGACVVPVPLLAGVDDAPSGTTITNVPVQVSDGLVTANATLQVSRLCTTVLQ